MITKSKTSTLIQSVVNVSRVYKKRWFYISTLHVYGQLDTSCIRVAVAELNVTLNPVPEDDHVSEAEIYIKTIEEMSICLHKTLPLKRITGWITM